MRSQSDTNRKTLSALSKVVNQLYQSLFTQNRKTSVDNLDRLLIRDSADGFDYKYVLGSDLPSGGSSYTFENGLTESTGTVKLGGDLTGNTNIDIKDNLFSIYFDDGSYSGKIEIGDSTFNITTWDQELYAGNRFDINLIGGVQLLAHNGVNNIKLEITELAFQITDNINSKGIVYVADYSSNFTDRSLVDKAYADSLLAVGLWSDGGGYLYPTTNNRSIKINTSGIASEGRVHYVYTEGGTTHFIVGTVRSAGIVYFRINADLALTDYTLQIKTDKTLQIGKVTTFEALAGYDADYSGSFTDHSLVTKKWVTDNFVAI